MAKIIFISREGSEEPRVSASPETVKRFVGLGFSVLVEQGAGERSGIPDGDFEAAGARIGKAGDAGTADIVLRVNRPAAAEIASYKSGAVVFAVMDPYGNEAALAAMAKAGLTTFAMELMPRITRAQSMDVLSSQANLAGYRAVIDASHEYGRALPMMMTAAGTVPAAKVFVMGAGVAGLQAIATARRLGAVVSATDVRPAAKEQVASLGAKFIAVEDDEFKAAETAAGYAKPMSEAYQAKQAALVAEHIAKQDIVITTALIPGRPAPRLVTRAMLSSMKPGSVAVDLAVERGGNIEGSEKGRVATVEGVAVIGYANVAGRIAASASALYARNLHAFIETMVDKGTKEFSVNAEDELVKATMLTNGGAVVHPTFAAAAAALPAQTPAGNAAEKPAAKTRPAKAARTADGPAKPVKAAAKPRRKPAADGAAASAGVAADDTPARKEEL
ncbi:Re/Si-specific NAD(P)(+) transhydrogenase subunit alpha [Neorhizobium sp. CSC1952]|uniref:Re/Si-specific NAD(P)(+) transhydrogenase subunit alpha n=1 Tax=Neorhizobium sp. CSC1952 TaxID=2978974 RepID=UPI0025A560C8|nr:Re/Si-specific NAD(P)(+) transhydrogenase subunit alpha [Rhizobium sp. CSC1952]WJR65532.1 Re/Si-specific NAD(P)(+) transhydrogenase subunit alpha [Rhizobium sp. CSC1952]